MIITNNAIRILPVPTRPRSEIRKDLEELRLMWQALPFRVQGAILGVLQDHYYGNGFYCNCGAIGMDDNGNCTVCHRKVG